MRDVSVQTTKGSGEASPVGSEDGEASSPEQIRFTTALSKVMSKELAPFLVGRDPTKVSIMDLERSQLMAGFWLCAGICIALKSNQQLMTRRSIGHLEGEARNYMINEAESERDTPEKVFEFPASRVGTGANRMQVRQAFMSQWQLEKED